MTFHREFVIILSYVTLGIARVHEDDIGYREEPQQGWGVGTLAHRRNMGFANVSERSFLVSWIAKWWGNNVITDMQDSVNLTEFQADDFETSHIAIEANHP